MAASENNAPFVNKLRRISRLFIGDI